MKGIAASGARNEFVADAAESKKSPRYYLNPEIALPLRGL